MELSVSTISEQAVVLVSTSFGGFLTKIAPPQGAKTWTGFATVIAALSFLAVKVFAHISPHSPAVLWGGVALVFVAGSIVICFVYIRTLFAMTVEYPFVGMRTIVGTEYTDQAKRFRDEEHSKGRDLTRAQMLMDAGGKVDRVWTDDSLSKARTALAARYSFFVGCLAFGLYLAIEVVNNAWPSMPPKPPVLPLGQRASELRDVHFELNKSGLGQDSSERLSQNADILNGIFRGFPNARLIIEGYCDDQGSFRYNLALGYKRAQAAEDTLAHYGISLAKMQVVSHGKDTSLCSEADEPCRKKNRRVHLTVVE